MAKKLMVQGPMPFIWNVSDKVGDTAKCSNSPNDVELVSFMLDYIEKHRGGGPGAVGGSGIKINGIFDTATAYCIYNIQATRTYNLSGYSNSAVDGIISPARHYDHVKWTIVYLNRVLFEQNRNIFLNLAENTVLSASLRAELSGIRIG